MLLAKLKVLSATRTVEGTVQCVCVCVCTAYVCTCTHVYIDTHVLYVLNDVCVMCCMYAVRGTGNARWMYVQHQMSSALMAVS